MRAASLLLLVLVTPSLAEAGSLPNPLDVFGTDNTPYTITFSGKGAEFEGRSYVRTGPNQFRQGSLPQTCGLATSIASQSELEITIRGVTATHREFTVPCRGKHQLASVRIRRFAFTPLPTPACVRGAETWVRSRGKGVATIDVDNPCDGSLKLTWAEGLAAWVNGDARGNRTAAKARWSGVLGKAKLSISATRDPTVRDVKAPKPLGLTGTFTVGPGRADTSP